MLKVFRQYFPLRALHQAAIDVALLLATALVAVRLQTAPETVDWPLILPSAIVFAVAMVGLNTVMGLYRQSRGASSGDTVRRVALSLGISVPIALLIFSLLPWAEATSTLTRYSTLSALGLVLLTRGLGARIGGEATANSRVMVVGVGPDAEEVRRVLAEDPARHGVLVGFFPGANDEECAVDARKTLPYGDLLMTVREHRVTEVVVALRERRGGSVSLRALLDCRLAGVKVTDLSTFFERTSGQIRVDSLRASWLIYGDGFRQGIARTVVKRGFDIVCSLVLLLLALPVMLLTALLILLEDGAPVFYRQSRVGRGGRAFDVVKFRSMRRDAEKDGRPRWASANDDRVTRVGRVIRKLRIDELPQLFNVLVGSMSLVGPRPERPYFVDQLVQDVPFYSVRHCVKPGVTGWAQVRYQYGASVDDSVEKLQYDLYYVKNHTLVLDIMILFETVRVVLTGEGAQ